MMMNSKKGTLYMTCTLAALVCYLTSLQAQDFTKTDPGVNKVVMDTTLVKAMEMTLTPGQKTNFHSHPAHFFYALSDGKIKVTYSDGEVAEYEFKQGDAGFGEPDRPHSTQNVGKTNLRILLVELNEHPYVDSKMKKSSTKN